MRRNRSKLKLDADAREEHLKQVHIILLVGVILVPNIVMVGSFSAMLYGLDTYNQVAGRSFQGDCLLAFFCVVVAILMIFDWWRLRTLFKVAIGAFPVLLFCAGAACKGRKYPWAPMLVALLFMPAGIGWVRYAFCRKVKRHKFYGAVAAVALYTAVLVGLVWAYYVYAPPKYAWDQDTKNRLARKASDVYKHVIKGGLVYDDDCGPDKNATRLGLLPRNERADIREACSKAGTVWFLSWMCPFVAIGCDVVLSVFCHVAGHIGKGDDISRLQKVLTKFVLVVAFLLAGMYACVTVSSSSLRLGSTLMAFFMAAIALLCLWTLSEVDLGTLADAAKHSQMMQQLVAVASSDWTRAMAVGALGGPLGAFICVDYLTNSMRKIKGTAGMSAHDRFTPIGRKIFDTVQTWDWSSLLLKIIILGEAFFTLQVGVSKVTYIFLSWLNTSLADTELAIVCVLVFFIGSSMFLLPPVPGLPVYVFAGILLGSKGLQTENVGFWGGIAIASILSLFTKLCACVGQYLIGYFLGKSLRVQQLIGVDKVPTRAIERVLKTRGLSAGKVALLVGGPDWPTSVTCGIIGVNIPQMLLGTIPVLALLVPCILAGACMGRVPPGEQSNWSLAANVSTASAAVVNMASMAYAVYTVSQVIQMHGDELSKPRPEHEAVAELTRREEGAVAAYKKTIAWVNLTGFWKAVLVLSSLGMYFCNVMFVVLAERCFRPFALSSKINDPYEDNGLKGHVLNIVLKPVGYGALAMFSMALLLHIVFSKVMACKAKALLVTSEPRA